MLIQTPVMDGVHAYEIQAIYSQYSDSSPFLLISIITGRTFI